MKEIARVGAFEGTLREVMLPMGLLAHEVLVSGGDVTLIRKPFSIRAPAATVRVEVREAALVAFLAKKAPAGLREVSVSLRDDRIYLTGRVRLLLEVGVAMTCRLRIHEGRQLFLDLEDVEVLGVAPKNLVRKQLDEINPLLDVADLPVPAQLRGVEIKEGSVFLHGTVSHR